MRIFGIDPGSERTGYGCVETDGRRHHLVACGAIMALSGDPFPQRLARIHRELTALLASHRPDCVAVENLFHASNARSALKLGHARGVAILAAVEAGCEVVEYTPAEVKRAVVGYGRAEKQQVQQMVKLLLGLREAPAPYDAADALAVAICHLHTLPPPGRLKAAPTRNDGAGRLKAAPTRNDGAGRLKPAPTRNDGAGRLKPAPTKNDEAGGLKAPPTRNTVAAAFRRPGTPAKSLKSWRQYRPPVG